MTKSKKISVIVAFSASYTGILHCRVYDKNHSVFSITKYKEMATSNIINYHVHLLYTKKLSTPRVEDWVYDYSTGAYFIADEDTDLSKVSRILASTDPNIKIGIAEEYIKFLSTTIGNIKLRTTTIIVSRNTPVVQSEKIHPVDFESKILKRITY